jgi:CPA2 family monovalent cation:H+ antiporter-2
VEILSEIGVILLLFIIGLEFSLSSLAAIQRTVFIGGTLQVAGTIGATALVFHAARMPLPGAVFLGFLLSLSSTAIVLKLLQEKARSAPRTAKLPSPSSSSRTLWWCP